MFEIFAKSKLGYLSLDVITWLDKFPFERIIKMFLQAVDCIPVGNCMVSMIEHVIFLQSVILNYSRTFFHLYFP